MSSRQHSLVHHLPDGRRLRMRDLVRETGLPRETIHFYISKGLLPEPVKTGRNTALYAEEHLTRLAQIKDLQETHFLPLKAIKAIFDDKSAASFTPHQREFIRHMRGNIEAGDDDLAPIRAPSMLTEVIDGSLSREEVDELVTEGLIRIETEDGKQFLGPLDAQIVQLWKDLKVAGLTPERGFHPAQLRVQSNAVDRMVQSEADSFMAGYIDASGREAADALQKVLPILNRLLVVLHNKKIHQMMDIFEASIDAPKTDG